MYSVAFASANVHGYSGKESSLVSIVYTNSLVKFDTSGKTWVDVHVAEMYLI